MILFRNGHKTAKAPQRMPQALIMGYVPEFSGRIWNSAHVAGTMDGRCGHISQTFEPAVPGNYAPSHTGSLLSVLVRPCMVIRKNTKMASDTNTAFYGVNGGMVPGSEDQEGSLDVLGFVRRRKWFIITLSILGVGISYLLFERQEPLYRSSAWVQVIHSTADSQLQSMVSERDLSDAVFVIASPHILVPAVEKHKLNQLEIFRGLSVAETAEELSGDIEVETPKEATAKSNVIAISFVGKNSGDTAVIVNAVAEQYIESQMENYKDARADLELLLTKSRDELHGMLQEKEEEYSKFRTASRLMSDGKNPHRTRHQFLLDEISKLQIQETSLNSQLTALDDVLKNDSSIEAREALMLLAERSGVTRPTPKAVEIAVPTDTSNIKEMEAYEKAVAEAARAEEEARIQAEADAENARLAAEKYVAEGLYPLQVELELLRNKFGPDHPKVRQQMQKIELSRSHLRSVASLISQKKTVIKPRLEPVPPRTPDTPPEPEEEPQIDFLAAYRDSIQQELLTVQSNRQKLETFAEKEELLARELMQDEILDRNKLKEMERLTQLFEEHVVKIRETKVNANIGGVKAQILTAAKTGELVFPILLKFIGLGGFLGGILGAGLGYLVEIADRSFRRPDDVIREFGLPIIGHIPFTKESQLKQIPSGSVFDKMAICVHLPRSRAAEAFRSVRTAICFSALGGSHRVIQVTSPTAGDGKSTLALNLAVAMAMSGKKTILIECDLRRPKVKKLTGVSGNKGIVDVLRGSAELTDAIQGTEVENFFVLHGGRQTKHPAELLVRPEFGQLLQVLREKFDYVIVDSPPVLAVSDPCGVAAQVDGVVLAMRLGKHTRDLGRRTLDQLRDVGASVTGLVINGVEEGDAYGYGAYRYGAYKGYSGKYGYGYSDSTDGKDSYYSDSDSDSAVSEVDHPQAVR